MFRHLRKKRVGHLHKDTDLINNKTTLDLWRRPLPNLMILRNDNKVKLIIDIKKLNLQNNYVNTR